MAYRVENVAIITNRKTFNLFRDFQTIESWFWGKHTFQIAPENLTLALQEDHAYSLQVIITTPNLLESIIEFIDEAVIFLVCLSLKDPETLLTPEMSIKLAEKGIEFLTTGMIHKRKNGQD